MRRRRSGAELYSYGEVSITNSFFDGNGYGGNLFDGSDIFANSDYFGGYNDGYEVLYYFLFDDANAFCEGLDENSVNFVALVFNPCESTDYLNFYMPYVDFYMEASVDDISGGYNSYDIEQEGGTGLYTYAGGNIFVDASSVDGNSDQGAFLYSDGNTTIENSTFNSNGEYGFVELSECISQYGSSECYSVFPLNYPDFGYNFYTEANYGNGLYTEADGALTIIESQINGNYDDGAIINGASIFIEQSNFDGNGYEVLFNDPDGMLSDYLCSGDFYLDVCSFLGSSLPLPVSEIHVDISAGIGLDEFDSFETNKAIIDKCIKNGVLTDWFLFNDKSLRIAPPLIITEEEIK